MPELMRFLALGDSYTIGEQVSAVDRWPVRLVNHLRAEGMVVADPLIIAQTGWTTSELNAGIDAAAPQGSFDLVSLLIGVNNQYRGLSRTAYHVEFRSLLGRAVGFAGEEPGRVMVLSIPDWGITPFAEANGRDPIVVAAEIDAFNHINYQEARAAGVHYVDVTPLSRQAKYAPDLIAADGLHPSAQMYQMWVSKLVPLVTKIAKHREKTS